MAMTNLGELGEYLGGIFGVEWCIQRLFRDVYHAVYLIARLAVVIGEADATETRYISQMERSCWRTGHFLGLEFQKNLLINNNLEPLD